MKKYKGKLEIKETQAGQDYIIHYEKKGKSKSQKVKFEIPDKFDGQECIFFRDKKDPRQIAKVQFGDETFPSPLSPSKSKSTSTGNRRGVKDAFHVSKTRLPKDTRELKIRDIDNFHLKLNKGARWERGDKKFKFMKTDRGSVEYLIRPNFSGFAEFEHIRDQYQTGIQLLENSGWKIKESSFSPDWRLIVGLGGVSVYEISMTLHFVYGFPYIPGSSIKGVTRNYVICEYFDKDEAKALKNPVFCKVFGNSAQEDRQGRKGKITFFDSYPNQVSDEMISPDIMNPHYPDYYGDESGKTPPTDDQSPIPVLFLTVQDTSFSFPLAAKEKDNNKIAFPPADFEGSLLDLAYQWLKEALELQGIGSKTAVGYGVMSEEEKD